MPDSRSSVRRDELTAAQKQLKDGLSKEERLAKEASSNLEQGLESLDPDLFASLPPRAGAWEEGVGAGRSRFEG